MYTWGYISCIVVLDGKYKNNRRKKPNGNKNIYAKNE